MLRNSLVIGALLLLSLPIIPESADAKTCPLGQRLVQGDCLDPANACIRQLGSDGVVGKNGSCECKEGYEINKEGRCSYVNKATKSSSRRLSTVQRRLENKSTNRIQKLSNPRPLTTSVRRSRAATAGIKRSDRNGLPINLVENQNWTISLERGPDMVDDVRLDDGQKLEVTRKGERFSLKVLNLDGKNGKYTIAEGDWGALFSTSCQEAEQCLAVYQYTYRYPDTRIGVNRRVLEFPVQISSKTVTSRDFYITYYWDEGIESSNSYTVKIIKADKASTSCQVRGESHGGEKIYYLSTSTHFSTLGSFDCFSNEAAAKKAGYKKSFE